MSTIAQVAAQQNTPTAATGTATSGTATSGTGALGALSGNFSTFLKLLMTQLRNQDPSSPLDTNQFTSQLVQYASVEQQINANANLTTLIGLTQSGDVLQSGAMLGRNVTATSPTLPLQQGKGRIDFTAADNGGATVVVTNAAGQQVFGQRVATTAGSNAWHWDGRGSDGTQQPDGAYGVTVTATAAGGSVATLPFTVTGTATGVTQAGNAVRVKMGDVTVDFSKVTTVAAP